VFKKIAIVGSGAIGIFYGMRLALAGAEVRFLLHRDLAAVRERGSLILRTEGGTTELRPAPVFGSTAEIGPVDLVIVTLKSTGNAELPRLLPPLLGRHTAILTLQNGLGSDEMLARLFGPERILGGLAYIASTRTGPGEVTCYQSEAITLGEFGRRPAARTRELAEQFTQAGVPTGIAENLEQARWEKLIWNVPFNGLAIAAGGVATDVLCADPRLRAEVRHLMREIQAAAARLGHILTDDFLQKRYDITPPMGAYRPSSLVDYLAGREVEIEPIWGEPLRRGEAAGAALPRLSLLYALIGRLVAARK